MPDASQADSAQPKNRIWQVGTAEFDEARRELRVGGQLRPVEAKPLLLLETLLVRAGDLVKKEELLAAVWRDRIVVEQSLTTAVSKLRTALGEQGRAIVEAVHGLGYRIGLPIELRTAPEPPRLAFTLQAGDPMPNRPQWRLERPLGHSAARDVWLARHGKTGEQRVFKFADTIDRLDALRREAALSRVLHNALGDRTDLVRIWEWNFDSRPFFIESSFGGESLPAWAAAKGGLLAIPLEQRIGIVIRVARTVAAAHDVGVLHQDITPSNVLIGGEADRLAVRLVDFGAGRLTEEAVRIAGRSLSAAGAQSVEGVRGGTLRYMAPEIFAGGPPTIVADVYALGILLYQMIVGDLDRSLGAGWEADVADPLLREDVREAASNDAARRLPSAQILVERLEALETRRAEQQQRNRLQQESARLAQQVERARMRRPWLILGVTSLAFGLVATSIFALRATHARNEAQREADTIKQVNTFLTDDLLGRGNPFNSGNADETLMQAASRAEPRIADRFAREPLIAASLYVALGQAFAGRSAFAEARVAYDRAVGAYERAEGGNSADATILRLRQVSMEVVATEAGSIERARRFVNDAKPVVATLGPRMPEALAWLLAAEGSLQMVGGDMHAAQLQFKTAGDLAASMPDRFDEHSRFDLRQREAFAYMRLRQWDEAGRILSTLLTQQLTLHGKRHPDTLLVMETQAAVLMSRGQSVAAIKAIDGIMPDLASVYGPGHRLTLQAYGTRAQAEGMVERYEDAARDDAIVYKASLAKQGSHAFYTFATLSDMAVSNCRAGHADIGLPDALQALEDAKATVGVTNAITQLISTGSVAFCLIMDKQYARATHYLDGFDIKATSDFSSDPDNAASFALMQAAIAINTGDKAHARALMKLPLKAFSRPDSDRFFQRWTSTLNQAASSPGDK